MINRLCLIFFLGINVLSGQVSEDLLVNVHSVVDETQMNSLTPEEGSFIYRTDLKAIFVYDGTKWIKQSTKETTYETIALSTGNQTITVRDADKIVGFTLISNSNWLAAASGRMSGTWMIGENRERIRCYIQTLEHPYVKFLVVSVEINNANNEIIFSNYSSRYWTITSATPQSNLSNNQNSYRLGKIVVIRNE